MAVDSTKRKLRFPPKFAPYLEKHRIFELFHEMAEELVKYQPKDHVTFLRDVLPVANIKRDKPRVVFISPPHVDRIEFAEQLARKADIKPIYRNQLHQYLEEDLISTENMDVVTEDNEVERLKQQRRIGSLLTCPCKRMDIDGTEAAEESSPEIRGEEVYKTGMTNVMEEDEGELELRVKMGSVTTESELQNESLQEYTKDESSSSESESEETEEIIDWRNYKTCPCKTNKRKIIGTKGSSSGFSSSDKKSNSSMICTVTSSSEKSDDISTESSSNDSVEIAVTSYTGERSEKVTDSNYSRCDKEFEDIESGIEKQMFVIDAISSSQETFTTKYTTTGVSNIGELLAAVVKLDTFANHGWILVDFPENQDEAKLLAKHGIIPTHALQIITTDPFKFKERKCQSNKLETESKEYFRKVYHAYKMTLIGWREVYMFVPITEIFVGQRNTEQLTSDCNKIIRIMPHHHPPMLPRILLIGARGSGVKTQAKKLAQKYRFVHINYDDLIAQTMLLDDDLSNIYKSQLPTAYIELEIEAAILERKMLSYECLKHGWVLTGYPRRLTEMKILDLIETPPNRVVFIELHPRQCYTRAYYREVDSCTGKKYKTEQTTWGDHCLENIDSEIRHRLKLHPNDVKQKIVREIEMFYLNRNDMSDYCKKTAAHIDGSKSIEAVFEQIEQVLINSSPACPHRNPVEVDPSNRQPSVNMIKVDDKFKRLTRKKISYVNLKLIQKFSKISEETDSTVD